MAETDRHHNGVALLRNVMAMVTLVERVVGRTPTLPGMAVFYGPSGYGKTTAATYAANTFDCYQVQVQSTWTRRSFCEAILVDLGIAPEGTIARMVNQISREIASTGRPLLIDEADHLVARDLVELVRDIYEASEAAIILIGEEGLPRKLMRWERVHGRMLDWVAAEPAVIDDVQHLAPHYAHGVEIEPALAEQLLQDSARSIRRICVNLDMLREHGQTTGTRLLTRKAWKESGKSFFTGAAPKPRGLK